MGFYAMGRRSDTSTGTALHHAVRLEWAFVGSAVSGVAWCAVFSSGSGTILLKHPSANVAEDKCCRHRVCIRLTTQGNDTGHPCSHEEVSKLVLEYLLFSYVWYFNITRLPTYLREGVDSSTRAAALPVLPLPFGGFGSLATGLAPVQLSRRAIAFFGFLGTAILLVAITHIHGVVPAMLVMGLASFCSDLTMPISWDTCAEIGGPYTATVAAAMNMLGNLAGFVAPVVGGMILQRTGGNWNILIHTMAAAATVSAICWLSLDPESTRRERELSIETAKAQMDAENLSP